MNKRIRELRKHYDLTQAEFGDRIKVKANTITNYETGLRMPSDAVINSICREFSVNETWLRTGEGEMLIPMTRDEMIAEYMGRVMFGKEKSTFQKSLISVMAKTSAEEWAVIEKKARELLEEIQKEAAALEDGCESST